MLLLVLFLEHQEFMIHDTYPRFSRSGGQPTYGYSHSSDQPYLYISRSSSRHAYRLESRLEIEDSLVVYRPTKQLTTSWMHMSSIQASLSK
jgi:hypothetical protein